MPTWQRAIIIGASSGIGAALARALARQGTAVGLVARRADELARVRDAVTTLGGTAHIYPHDVRDLDAAAGLFQQIAQDLGGVDLVIYAAGIMGHGDIHTYDTANDREVITTDLLGAIAWLNAAAQRFDTLGGGTIVGISSVAGERGRRGDPAYATAKAGMTTYLEALRNRLAPRGTTVVTIKPGYIATPMIAGARLPRVFPIASADRAATLILRAAAFKRPTSFVPGFWRPVAFLLRAIPSRIFRQLNV